METRSVKLIDHSGHLVATAQVADKGTHYGGTIDLRPTPEPLHALFEEFDELVNTQVFSLVDEVDEKISAFGIRAVFDDGREVEIVDLQVYPSTGGVSFKVVAAPFNLSGQIVHRTG
jgi:hypothetical protein